MAQQLKGKLVKGPYKQIHRNCAIYFFFIVSRCLNRVWVGYFPQIFPVIFFHVKRAFFFLTNGWDPAQIIRAASREGGKFSKK